MQAMILLRNDSEEGIDMQSIWALFKHLFKRDVTRKNKTTHVQEEHAAIQHRNELEVAFDSLTDGIILFGETGRGKFVNKGYRDLFIAGEPDVYQRSLHERAAIHILLDTQGKPMPEEQWPIVRVLRGLHGQKP